MATSQRNDTFLEVFRWHTAVMLLIDPETGRILDANVAAEKFYGYTSEQFKQLFITDINQQPPEQVAANIKQASHHERNYFVFPHKMANGDIHTVEVYSTPIAWNGRGVLFSIIQDITERARAEAALRESEERYRSLFNNMMDGIYRSTHEGRFVDINPAMVRMFGYSSREEMLNVDIKKELYFSPEERGSHILDTGMQETEVYRMRRKDGSEIWVEDHGYYVHDEQGNILFHEGLLRDVTERIKAEQALRENELLLKESQEIAGLGSYVLDITTGSWRSSSVLDEIFGIDDSFVRSIEGWASIVHPDFREEMMGYFEREIVHKHHRFDREYKIIRQIDKEERWVHGMGELEIDQDGNLLKLKGSIQDITERRAIEDALRQRLLELEALYNISSSLRSTRTFEQSLPIFLNETLAAIGTDAGSVLLYDSNQSELRAVYSRGWYLKIEHIPVKPGQGMAGMVFETGEPYISTEFLSDPLLQTERKGDVPAGWGGACLPLRVGTEIVGVIFVAVQLPRQITQDHMRLLQSLSEIAGTTLHRQRLYEEASRRAVEFESLYETSKALSEYTELMPLLGSIVETAKRLLNANSSGMYLWNESTQELSLTMDTANFVSLGTRLKLGEGVAGQVALSRKPMRVTDYSNWEGRSSIYDGIPIGAVLEVPMLYGGELIGVLTVDEVGGSPREFTVSDERLLSLFASQAAGVIHSARLRDEALQRLQNLQTLYAIDKAIASSLDMRITLNILLSHVVNQLGVDAASVLLIRPYEQTLRYAAGRGFRTRLIESADFSLNDKYAGRSVVERRVVQVTHPSQIVDNAPFAALWADEEFLNYVCVPLIVKGEVKGVLETYRRTVFTPTPEWLEFLETLASQAAIAIDNTQMFDNLQRVNMELAIAYEATIEGWAYALDLRDQSGQSQRLTDMTLSLAKIMGIRDSELQHIRRGALLHDIGKMGISDHILLKKGKLTEKEMEEMQRHPVIAYQLLYPIQYLRSALDIPYCHHEKWDGTGYPRGLKGEQIPLAARIFAVVDVWDALISPRPHRKAWTAKRAIAYIREQSGKHFDPRVVEAFLQNLESIQ